jgi:large subunit ribosomal protein L19
MDAAQLLKKPANPRIPRFSAGDTVRVNFRIREGERERIQVFQGVVIRLQNGKGPAASFTVRRITAGIGIERVFPLHSPLVESLEVTRYGSVRRAKLYYLRGLQGRAARIKELNPVQRRKAQEEAAAAEAELAEQIAAAVAETEEPQVEEPVDDLEDQPTDEVEEAPVDEAPEEPSDESVAEAEEVADEPVAEVEEPEAEAEEPAGEPAEEPPPEGPPVEEEPEKE